MRNKARPFDYFVDSNGCFKVTSHKPNKDGYTAMKINRIERKMHRHVYEEMYGQIPEGLVVRHKCDNPSCINPEHLETGTHADNARDMYERGRSYSRVGENNSCAKLTNDEVKEIKTGLLKGVAGAELAEKYGVTTAMINRIKKGKAWSSVTVDESEVVKMKALNSNERIVVTLGQKTKPLKEWCEILGINYGTVSSRISRGLSPVEALINPLTRRLK